MKSRCEMLCRELSLYTEKERKTILEKISNDGKLPPKVKEIIEFLILNCRLFALPSAPSNQRESEPARSPAKQVIRRLSF